MIREVMSAVPGGLTGGKVGGGKARATSISHAGHSHQLGLPASASTFMQPAHTPNLAIWQMLWKG